MTSPSPIGPPWQPQPQGKLNYSVKNCTFAGKPAHNGIFSHLTERLHNAALAQPPDTAGGETLQALQHFVTFIPSITSGLLQRLRNVLCPRKAPIQQPGNNQLMFWGVLRQSRWVKIRTRAVVAFQIKSLFLRQEGIKQNTKYVWRNILSVSLLLIVE